MNEEVTTEGPLHSSTLDSWFLIEDLFCLTIEEWYANAIFGCYAWNASPVTGTDVQRAFPATGKHWIFPIDVTAEQIGETVMQRQHKLKRLTQRQRGQATLEYIDTMFRLLKRQQMVLKILNEERRTYHRELKNNARKRRKFDTGDIVLVRKQIMSNAFPFSAPLPYCGVLLKF